MAKKIASTVVTIVLIIARIQFKSDSRKVVYLVRASNGTSQYEVHMFEGKASSCTCPSRKPCKHMKTCEAKEAARQQFQVEATAKAEQREAALAKAREESAAYLAQAEVRIEAEQADRPKSEQARIADLAAVTPVSPAGTSQVIPLAKAATFQDLKACYDVRDLHTAVATKVSEAKQRQTATLAGASRPFSLMR